MHSAHLSAMGTKSVIKVKKQSCLFASVFFTFLTKMIASVKYAGHDTVHTVRLLVHMVIKQCNMYYKGSLEVTE